MNYLAGLLGALVLIATWLKVEKDRRDDKLIAGKKEKIPWRVYFETHWDDYAYAILGTIFLVFLQEYIFALYIFASERIEFLPELTDPWNLYYDVEELVSALMGLLSTTIIKLIFKKAKKLENL